MNLEQTLTPAPNFVQDALAMGRKPKIDLDEDGNATVRAKIPRPLWLICERLAAEYGFTPAKALEMILTTVGVQLADPTQHVQVTRLLGPLVEHALRRVRAENFGVIKSGPAIDIEALHKSSKTNSGFVGIYISGKGFRATGRIPGTIHTKHLGTFETAEEAAWHRFQYYKEMNLPYGVWEERLDRERSKGNPGSDAQILAVLERDNIDAGVPHWNSLPGKPIKPNTRPPGVPEELAHVFEADFGKTRGSVGDDEGAMIDVIAQMRAENDARELASTGEVNDRPDDDAEAG